jgi:hypothetical protein
VRFGGPEVANGSSNVSTVKHILVNATTGVRFVFLPGEPLSDLSVPAGEYLLYTIERTQSGEDRTSAPVIVTQNGSVMRPSSDATTSLLTASTIASSSTSNREIRLSVGRNTFGSDETVNVSVAVVDTSGRVPTLVRNTGLNLTLDGPGSDNSWRAYTGSSGVATISYDFSGSPNGSYTVEASSTELGTTESLSFTAGPQVEVYPHFADNIEVGRSVTVAVAITERGEPQDGTTTNVTLTHPNGTSRVRTLTTDSDGFATFQFTPTTVGDYSIYPTELPGSGTTLTAGDVLGQIRTNGEEYEADVPGGAPVQLTGYLMDGAAPASNRNTVVRIFNTTSSYEGTPIANISTTTDAYGQYVATWQTPPVPGAEFEARLYTASGERIPHDGGRIELRPARDAGSGEPDSTARLDVEFQTPTYEHIVAPGSTATATVRATENGSMVPGVDVTYALQYGYDGVVAANGTVTTNQTGMATISVPTPADAPDGASLRLRTAATINGTQRSETAYGDLQRYRINEERLGSTTPGETASYELRFVDAATGDAISGVPMTLSAEYHDRLHGSVFETGSADSGSDGTASVSVTLPKGLSREFLYGPQYPYFDGGFPTMTATGYEGTINGLPDRELRPGETITFNYTTNSPDETRATVVVSTWRDDVPPAPFATRATEGEQLQLTVPNVSEETYYSIEVRSINGSGSTTLIEDAIRVLGSEDPASDLVADAGADQRVIEDTMVQLNATGSADLSGGNLTYTWQQEYGPSVTLSNASSPTPTFTAPDLDYRRGLGFELTISNGEATATDRVEVTVLPDGPTLQNVSVLNESVSTGEQLVALVNVSDEAGIESLGVRLETTYEGREYDIDLGEYFESPQPNGTYRVSRVLERLPNGTYTVTEVSATDGQDNRREYRGAALPAQPSVVVRSNATDFDGPSVRDVSVRNESVKPGERLVAMVNVSDPSGVESINVEFSATDESVSEQVSLSRYFETPQPNGTYRVSGPVDRVPNGTYRLQSVSTSDAYDNYEYYSDEELPARPTLVVNSTATDFDPPQIRNVSFTNETISSGDVLEVRVNASDATGIKQIDVRLEPRVRDGTTDTYFLSRTFNTSQPNGTHLLRQVIDGRIPNGTVYTVDYLRVYDPGTNEAYRSGDELTPQPTVEVLSNATDFVGPSIQNVSLRNASVSPDDRIQARVNLTDASNITQVSLEVVATDGSDHEIYLSRYFDEPRANGTYLVNGTVPRLPNGTYALQSASTQDGLNNYRYYSADQLPVRPTVLVDSNATDFEPPEVRGVSLANQTVQQGETLVAQVNVSDATNIQRIAVRLESSTDSIYASRYFDEPVTNGTYEVQELIGTYVQNGTYQVTSVRVSDSVDNYGNYYGSDLPSQPTVEVGPEDDPTGTPTPTPTPITSTPTPTPITSTPTPTPITSTPTPTPDSPTPTPTPSTLTPTPTPSTLTPTPTPTTLTPTPTPTTLTPTPTPTSPTPTPTPTPTDPPNFQISGAHSPENVTIGDSLEVSAEINNTGGAGTQAIEAGIDTDQSGTLDSGEVRSSTQLTVDANVTRSTTLQVDTSGVDPGQFTVIVRSANDTATTPISLQPDRLPDPPTAPISGDGTGDPHMTTFDGVNYDFQAAGEFVLAREPGGSLAVQARLTPVSSRPVSVIEAVATSVDGHNVTIDAADTTPLTIDGQRVSLPDGENTSAGAGEVFRRGDTYIVIYPGEDGVISDGDERLRAVVRGDRIDARVILDDQRSTAVRGLLGSPDGNSSNDIALANGTVLERPLTFEQLYGSFRADYRVTNATTLFHYEAGESPGAFFQSEYPRELVTVESLDEAAREQAAEQARKAGLTPGTAAFENAVLDYALTNDTSYLDSARESQAATDTTEETTVRSREDVLVAASPNRSTLRPGETVTVPVDLDTGTQSVYAAQANLRFNTTMLDVVSLSPGPVLGSDGNETIVVANTTNESAGVVKYGETRQGDREIQGTGTLFTVTFRVNDSSPVDRGARLTLERVEVPDKNGTALNTTVRDATVYIPTNQPPALNASLETVVNNVGSPIRVNMSASDGDGLSTLRLYGPDGRLQASQECTAPACTATLNATPTTSSWNGTEYASVTYRAVAIDEVGTNATVDLATSVAIAGDTNGDGAVDIFDAVSIGRSWDSQRNGRRYSEGADLNNDGTVNVLDAVLVGSNWQNGTTERAEDTPESVRIDTNTTPVVGQTVQFSARTSGLDTGVESYTWTIGNATAQGETVSYSPTRRLNLTLELTLAFTNGSFTTVTRTVQVREPVEMDLYSEIELGGHVISTGASPTPYDAARYGTLTWDLDGDRQYETTGGTVRDRLVQSNGTYQIGARITTDNRSPAVARTNVTVRSIDDSFNIAWAYQNQTGYETLIAGNRLYVVRGQGQEGGRRLVEIDRRDGTVNWSTSVGFSMYEVRLTDGGLYGIGRGIAKLDAETGSPLWRYTPDAEYPEVERIDNETAYVSQGGSLVALDVSTGTVEWQYDSGVEYLYISDIGPKTVFLDADDNLTAIDRSTGEERWNRSVTEYIDEVYSAGNTVVYTDGGQQIIARNTTTGATRWSQSASYPNAIGIINETFVYAGDGFIRGLALDNGTEQWRTDISSGYVSEVIWQGQLLVLVDSGSGGELLALTPAGETLWNSSTAPPNELRVGNGTAAPETLFVGSEAGVTAFNATDGTVRWDRTGLGWSYIEHVGDELVVEAEDAGYVLNRTDGGTVWQTNSTSVTYGRYHNGTFYVPTGGGVYAIHPENPLT